jgi:16S rRNA (adenine1518-N6/adenine1519-N6)-dimethyltransferase
MPYYITGPLLNVIAQASSSYKVAVLMMQKEVGQRILAPAGSSARGSLSVYLQGLFTINKVSDAPKGAFYPPPKVDSIVLEFVPLPVRPDEKFFSFVRSCFGQPRKTLVNNLIAGQHIDRSQAAQWISSAGFIETARPQELTQDQWERLYEVAKQDGSIS